MFIIEVKENGRKKWNRMSVGLHHKSTYDTWVNNAHLYMAQYAIDNQMSIYRLSVRVIDDTTDKVVFYLPSAAEANRRG